MTHSKRRRGHVVSFFAILSLALGIAGNVVVFSLISPTIFKPLPYPNPDRIVLLGQRAKGQPDITMFSLLSSLGVWADYRERSRTLTEWAALNLTFMSRSLGDRSVSFMAGRVTPSFFRVLGAVPVRGRLFMDAEGVVGGPKVAVLDWDFWQTSLGAESDVVGMVLTLDGAPHEVIGVLPEGFEFITPQVDVWVPLQRDPYEYGRHSRWTISIARMEPGATMAQVEAEVAQIAEDIESEHPESFRGWTMDAINLRTEFPDRHSRLYLGIILGTVLFVLLIACANITNLLLARNQDRRWEIALRTALGAGRLRIFLRLARESVAMAAMGGTVGLLLAALTMQLTSDRLGRWMPRMWHPSLDAGVVLFTVATTVLCGVVFGLLPAIQSLRGDQVETLKRREGAGSGGGRRRGLVSTSLVVAQIALCFVALGGGSILARSFSGLINQDPGFDTSGLLTARFEIPDWKYESAEVIPLLKEVQEQAVALPGVASAALVLPLPKDIFATAEPFHIESQPIQEGDLAPQAIAVIASPEYLETLGIPLLQGRFFEESDGMDAPRVAVINREVVERHFGGRSPVGDRIVLRDTSWEIVGVAADVQQSLVPHAGGGLQEAVYIPLLQAPYLNPYLVLRTTGEPRAWAEPLRQTIWNVDPDIPVNTVETIDEFASRYTGVMEISNVILAAFGVLALLLASLGTYGVVAYSMGQRTHEIGVRLAIGARPMEVVALVAKQGIRMSILGLIIGGLLLIPVVAAVGSVLAGFGLEPVEPITLLAIAALLFLVTLVATVVPASRAASVDPVRVLKAE